MPANVFQSMWNGIKQNVSNIGDVLSGRAFQKDYTSARIDGNTSYAVNGTWYSPNGTKLGSAMESPKVQNSNSAGSLLGNITKGLTNTASALSGKVSNAADSIMQQAYSTSALKNAYADQQRILDYNSVEAEKNREAQREENALNRDFNSSEAQKQRDWETEMSNTAFQRSVADMKAAGINPLYSANIGGASTPSGSSASFSGSVSGQASAGYYDYAKAKDSDKSSIWNDVFGDLFKELMSNTTKMDIAYMNNATSKQLGALSVLTKLIP